MRTEMMCLDIQFLDDDGEVTNTMTLDGTEEEVAAQLSEILDNLEEV